MSTAHENAARADLIGTAQAGRVLGRHPSRVQNMIQSGVLRVGVDAFKIGGEWRIVPEALNRAEVQQRPVGRPRQQGSRVRTDRINEQVVLPDEEARASRQPLTPQDRYTIQHKVRDAITLARRNLTNAEMVDAALPALHGKGWPRAVAVEVVNLILFGQSA